MSKHAAEYRLQIACVDHLYARVRKGRQVFPTGKRPFPELFAPNGYQNFTHINQGRSAKDGHMLKLMGQRAGVTDFWMWPQKFMAVVDMKVTGGLSSDQKQFFSVMQDRGVKTGTATSVTELYALLIKWGLTCENHVVQEPDLRSWDDKVQAGIDFYRP